MSINLHFTPQDWDRVKQAWSAWWAGELERPLVVIEGKEVPPGVTLPEVHSFTCNFPLDMPVDEVLDRYQAHLEATRFYGDAWPKWWPNFGPGIIAGFLGAQVHRAPDTVWFACPGGQAGEPAQQVHIEDLHLDYDADNVWWRRVCELTHRAVERWGDNVAVGLSDIGMNFDILASLRTTQQMLMDLYDAPDEVARLLGEITRLWLRYYDELYAFIRAAGRGTTPWAAIWSPGRCYMLQSDFSYLISPQMFERFVLPDLAAACERLDHTLYHLDGKGQIPHLDMLLALERLHGIQWVPGGGQPPPEEWLFLLKRIRDANKLCQLYVSPQGALTIARELGGRGFAFYITQSMSQPEAQDFLSLMKEVTP